MGLSSDLLALAPALLGTDEAAPDWRHGDSAPAAAVLCPRLRSNLVPSAGFRKRQEGTDRRPSWSRVWDPAPAPDPLGSSPARNPKRPPRYGLKGLPAAGRRAVWRALSLMEESRPFLCFWTVTVPPAAVEALRAADSVGAFADRLRKELVRRLQLAGLQPLVVGVCELQPKRSRREGRPLPHWHVVFRNTRSPWGPWVLDREVLDGCIAAALATAGAAGVPVGAAGRRERIRKSVRGYMAAYLTKDGCDPSPWVGGEWEALLPRQWWFWSAPLREFVLRHVLPICWDFLAWVWKWREEIEAVGLARFRRIPLQDPRAPAVWEINWQSCANVAELLCLAGEDEWDIEWRRTSLRNQWQP